MWRGLRDWQRLSESWLGTVFEEIDVEQIKSSCEKYTRIVSKSSKKLPPNPVLETLRRLLAQFKDAMPVVIALSSRAVQ